MNTIITSKEAILAASKQIAAREGLANLSIREISKQCGIAVGSVYNYFPSKDAIIAETIGAIWDELIAQAQVFSGNCSFVAAVEQFFFMAKKGTEKYPNFLTMHSRSFHLAGKDHGKVKMTAYFTSVSERLIAVLKADSGVSPQAFGPTFDQASFVGFVLKSMLALLQSQSDDCRVLTHMISRTIY